MSMPVRSDSVAGPMGMPNSSMAFSTAAESTPSALR